MNWSIQIPEKPTPTLVLVTNISPTTSDKVVKEFFLFCGKIVEFEVQNDEATNTRTALIQFDKGSSSKTAIMLSNAMIGDRHIQVRGYFDEPSTEQTRAPGGSESLEEAQEPGTSGQDKSFKVTSFMSDFLSKGYELSGQLYKNAQDIDTKYGISTTVGTYTELAKQEALKLDQKLQVSQRAVNLDQQLKISERLDQVAKSALQLGQDALKTEPGKKVTEAIHVARDKIAQVHQESLSKMEATRRAKESNDSVHPTEAGAREDTQTSTLYNADATQPPQYTSPAPPPAAVPSANGAAESSQAPATSAPVDEKAALKNADQ